jgi:hypothetical protein
VAGGGRGSRRVMASDDPAGAGQGSARPVPESCPAGCLAHREHVYILSAAPLDIPYAVSFADAVWQSRTGFPLFARPDPASIARLTQPCDSEGTFNSLMSALADVLSQVARPGTGKAPRSGALEEVRAYLNQELDPPAAARCAAAIGKLIRLRTIRHSIEHGDARAKAVAAYAELDLAFPVGDWPGAWSQISATACGALDALREEVHAGLPAAERSAGRGRPA